jgi:hypothetical protein
MNQVVANPEMLASESESIFNFFMTILNEKVSLEQSMGSSGYGKESTGTLG